MAENHLLFLTPHSKRSDNCYDFPVAVFRQILSYFKDRALKLISISIFLIALTPFTAFSISGSQVIENAFQSNYIENFLAEIELSTKTDSGKKSLLKLSVLGKGDPLNALSLLIIFRDPPSAKGIKFLVKSRRNTPTAAYIYMPAMKKYFLLSGEDRNMKLGESEFTLNDLVSSIPWDGTHQILQESEYSGHPCYVIETHLAEKPEKRVTWIDKNNFLPVNSQYFDAKGTLIKTLTATKFINAFGKHRIVSLRVTNHQNMIITTMTVLSGQWHLDIPAAPFKPENLSLPISELIDFKRNDN